VKPILELPSLIPRGLPLNRVKLRICFTGQVAEQIGFIACGGVAFSLCDEHSGKIREDSCELVDEKKDLVHECTRIGTNEEGNFRCSMITEEYSWRFADNQGDTMDIVKFEQVESKVLEIQGIKVILDSDLAELYGVETKRINEAVKNNPDRFPSDYITELTHEEKSELVENFDRFKRLKHSSVTPKAFTEKGLYMLATILKSPRAVQTTFAIIETFGFGNFPGISRPSPMFRTRRNSSP